MSRASPECVGAST